MLSCILFEFKIIPDLNDLNSNLNYNFKNKKSLLRE